MKNNVQKPHFISLNFFSKTFFYKFSHMINFFLRKLSLFSLNFNGRYFFKFPHKIFKSFPLAAWCCPQRVMRSVFFPRNSENSVRTSPRPCWTTRGLLSSWKSCSITTRQALRMSTGRGCISTDSNSPSNSSKKK